MSMMEPVTGNVSTTTKLRGCNPSFVTTSDGVVVVDTPQLPTKAVAMRAEAEARGPIRFIVNTEHHVDHIFGNYWFKGAGTVVNHLGLYERFMVVFPELDPFAYAYESVPGETAQGTDLDDPAALDLWPDREDLLPGPEQGPHRVHRRRDAAGRQPHVQLPAHARAHARPARGPRARGGRRVHGRHDLLRLPDVADDLGRQPVAGGAGADPDAGLRAHRARPRAGRPEVVPRRQRSVLLAWTSAVATAIAKGWSRDETIERVNFKEEFGPVDIGQGYMLDYIQSRNAAALYDKLTGTTPAAHGTRREPGEGLTTTRDAGREAEPASTLGPPEFALYSRGEYQSDRHAVALVR